MTTIPAPVNKTVETADAIIQFALYQVAVKALTTYARAQFSFLNLPVVSQLFNLLVNSITDQLYKFLAQTATFTIIDLQVSAEKAAYAKTEAALRAVHLTGSQEAINAATINFKSALAGLVRFNGVGAS